MRSRVSLIALLLCSTAVPLAAKWPEVLTSAGIDLRQVVLLEGNSAAANQAGFLASERSVSVQSVVDRFDPSLSMVWEHAVSVPVFDVPSQAIIFVREKRTQAPLVAGFRSQGKAVLWTAVSPGEVGTERFPYLAQALGELGVRPVGGARDLWIFFDSSYRLRADVDYLATQWRNGGVAALHVAAWQYWEPDTARDAWLKELIEACHRHAILIYAWIELPHVSAQFWQQHPEWREKTATGQDAQLDWRQLMNLQEPQCATAVARGLTALMDRFSWDGLNAGELYFESLESYLNPARFTPMNPQVRASFQASQGFDPLEMWDPQSPRFHRKDAAPMRAWLDYRAGLVRTMQTEWMDRMRAEQSRHPGLDLVLTHIDDRFDTTMRDKLGADAASALEEAAKRDITFLIEDPATLWNLGAQRYPEIARRYAPLVQNAARFSNNDAARHDGNGAARLAIDLNIVERYQDVYPTKQQTGLELFALIRAAAQSFPRVALYFENSIRPVDWPWLAASASPAQPVAAQDGSVAVSTQRPYALRWQGCAEVDGTEWPVGDASQILLPAGEFTVKPCSSTQPRPLLDFNGTLRSARMDDHGSVTIDYESRTRAIAILQASPTVPYLLAPGRHRVTLHPASSPLGSSNTPALVSAAPYN